MSVVLQIYAIIVTLSLIIVLSFYLLHRREVTRLSQKLQITFTIHLPMRN